jgi:uncharacterized protein YecE (DUF72 family)
MNPLQEQVRIACAGWSIPAAQRARFAVGDSVLARYASKFDAVEINSSFYRPHQRQTYARWAASVPARFRFSVKLPRAITHEARLRRCGLLLDEFLEQCGGLGRKLGVLLLQLPPSLALDVRSTAPFLSRLRAGWDGDVACEPRHASWFTSRAEAMLLRHRIARVAADPALHSGGGLPGGDPTLAYWRWHGAPRIYYSDYDESWLRARAMLLHAEAERHRRTWVVFDNTAHGHATANALLLQALLRH